MHCSSLSSPIACRCCPGSASLQLSHCSHCSLCLSNTPLSITPWNPFPFPFLVLVMWTLTPARGNDCKPVRRRRALQVRQPCQPGRGPARGVWAAPCSLRRLCTPVLRGRRRRRQRPGRECARRRRSGQYHGRCLQRSRYTSYRGSGHSGERRQRGRRGQRRRSRHGGRSRPSHCARITYVEARLPEAHCHAARHAPAETLSRRASSLYVRSEVEAFSTRPVHAQADTELDTDCLSKPGSRSRAVISGDEGRRKGH